MPVQLTSSTPFEVLFCEYEIAAPGVRIYSTCTNNTWLVSLYLRARNNIYVHMCGTCSNAAAFPNERIEMAFFAFSGQLATLRGLYM